MIKIIVAGPRDYGDEKHVHSILNKEIPKHGNKEDITIISGMARGVDTIAYNWAKENGYKVDPHPANWDDLTEQPSCIEINGWGEYYNKCAGYNRNERMAKIGDILILIWDGKTSGSGNMRENAEKYGLKIIEFIIERNV